jgi:uncharacterized sulfatase
VILVSDDQDYEHFGFAGHPQAHTPRIDALARAGVRFDHAFVPMSRCRPAQASLLSGEWPHQSGVYFNVAADHIDPDTCIANRLGEVGYDAYGEGKFWEYDPRVMGFEHYTIRNYETFAREGQEHLFEWLRERDPERPFFLWWAPELPHEPHDPPARLLDLVDRDAIGVPTWFSGDADAYRDAERLSLAMVAWLDEAVGELLDELEALGQLEDTLVLFLVDNGWANGLPSKGTAFDKGLRTPAILHWPAGLEGGTRHEGMISAVDLYATLLDLAGATPTASCQGRSLGPLMAGEADAFAGRETLYGAVYPQRPTEVLARPERDAYALWARTERFKYVLYLKDVRAADNASLHIQFNLCDYPQRARGDEDLFDLASDPYELDDRSDDPELHAERERLREEVIEWWVQTGGGELALP